MQCNASTMNKLPFTYSYSVVSLHYIKNTQQHLNKLNLPNISYILHLITDNVADIVLPLPH